jgi:acyl-CoA thioester hydrolase
MSITPFRHSHRVTYAECTAGNHVYYGRYLDLLEEARGAFFRELGTSFREWQQRDVIFPVIECTLRYRSPARYDDLLAIEVRITSLERVRLNLSYRIINEARAVVLEGNTHHVCTGLNEKLKRIPEELATILAPHVQT